MLSEEEIIEECNELAENKLHQLGECWDEEYSKKAIQGLLDLYNKEKEKNKRIKDGVLIVGRRNGKSAEQKIILDKYISKDKIKAKIEELNDLNSPFAQRVIKGKEVYLTEMVQNILQSLLEKE